MRGLMAISVANQKNVMPKAAAPSDQQDFPVLDVAQIARLRLFGTARRTDADEVLIEIGDDIPGLFVVLEGQTRLVDRTNDDQVIRTSGGYERSADSSPLLKYI
jgi:hypothetical protein